MYINVLIAVHLPSWWEELAIRRYAKYASGRIAIRGTSLTAGQEKRATHESLSSLLLENARIAEKNGATAHIIDCFGDPGLRFLAERLTKPVVGVGQAGLCHAYRTSERYAVLTSEAQVVDEINQHASEYGVDARLVSVRSIDIPATEVPTREEEVLQRLVQEASRFGNSVDGIVLGCTELAEFAPLLEKRLRSTGYKGQCVNPIACAIRETEMRITATG